MANTKKLGLALGSGAFKGLFHVGLIRSLVKNHIPIDYISGTSAGAIVGAHYALFQDLDRLENFVTNHKYEKLMALLAPSFRSGLVKSDKMYAFWKSVFGQATFNDLKIPFNAVATDLLSGQPEVIKVGYLAKAVQASMSIPTLLEPTIMNGRPLVDGFLSNPVPDDVAKKMGADVVLSVNLDNYERHDDFDPGKMSMLQVSLRSFEIMRHSSAKHSIQNTDLLIEPPGLYEYESWQEYFVGKKVESLIKMGEDTMDVNLPTLLKLLNVSNER
jgi:NTE family protein